MYVQKCPKTIFRFVSYHTKIFIVISTEVFISKVKKINIGLMGCCKKTQMNSDLKIVYMSNVKTSSIILCSYKSKHLIKEGTYNEMAI
jgi:hypothetical protein